jgi:hypothetical protein
MVWGAFCSDQMLHLAVTSTRMNSVEYTSVLESHLLPFFDGRNLAEWTYQQDNAAIHTSRLTKGWLLERGVNVLDWPSCSPDLNPIENVWGILVRCVYADNRQFQNVADLRAAVMDAWDQISHDTRKKLVGTMQNRIFELITRLGGLTHY